MKKIKRYNNVDHPPAGCLCIFTAIMFLVFMQSCDSKSDTQKWLDKAIDKTIVKTKGEGGSEPVHVEQKTVLSNTALKNLYHSYVKQLALVQKKPKYKIIGKITDSSEYPEVMCVFGAVLKEQPRGRPHGFDKCVHLNSNICIVKPKPKNNFYYIGEHCCLDLMTEGENTFGVSVPMYWYGDCTMDEELTTIKKQITEELLNLYNQFGASRTSYVARGVNDGVDDEMKAAFAFLDSIGNADGYQAIQYVIASKRNKGSYIPTKMNEYYGSLEIPITVIDMFNDNASNVVAIYYSKEYGKPVKIILASISMVDVAGEKQIKKITHLVEAEY